MSGRVMRSHRRALGLRPAVGHEEDGHAQTMCPRDELGCAWHGVGAGLFGPRQPLLIVEWATVSDQARLERRIVEHRLIDVEDDGGR